MRKQERIHALPDLLDVLSGLIELEQTRGIVLERPAGALGHGDVAGSRVDEDMSLRIGRHADRFAQIDVVGHRKEVRLGIEGYVSNRQLGPKRDGENHRRGRYQEYL